MTGKKALIVWGGWEGHTPERSADVVKGMLENHGFQVTLENETAAYADPGLGENDLIVPMMTMSTIEKEELGNLLEAVRKAPDLRGFTGRWVTVFAMNPTISS